MPANLGQWKSLIGKDFRYPSTEVDDLLRLEAQLSSQDTALGPVLGIFSGGKLQAAKWLLLPQGIVKFGRWRIVDKGWQFQGWVLRFADVSKPKTFYSQTLNGIKDRFALIYFDQMGKERNVPLLFEMDRPIVRTVMWSLLVPDFYRHGIMLKESASIAISGRYIKESKEFGKIASVNGNLVAHGPFASVTDAPQGKKLLFEWGPVLGLLPRNVSDWEARLTRLWREAAEKLEPLSIVAHVAGQPEIALAAAVLSHIKPGDEIDLHEIMTLPIAKTFMEEAHRFAGPLNDVEGMDRKWELQNGGFDAAHFYVFRNYWLYRCLVWADQNLVINEPPSTSQPAALPNDAARV